jgi:hypothetical protein
LVFFKTGPLTDKYQFGPGIAGTKYNVTALLRQAAALAITQIRSNILKGIGEALRTSPPLFDLCQRLRRAVEPAPAADRQPPETSVNLRKSPVKCMFIDHR